MFKLLNIKNLCKSGDWLFWSIELQKSGKEALPFHCKSIRKHFEPGLSGGQY
jgi:hypothetical protein